jgi:hypothetical protein
LSHRCAFVLLLVYFDADLRVYEIWMLTREMTTRAIREPGPRDEFAAAVRST